MQLSMNPRTPYSPNSQRKDQPRIPSPSLAKNPKPLNPIPRFLSLSLDPRRKRA